MDYRFPLSKRNAFVMALFHVVAIVELFFPSWDRLYLALITWYVFGCIGVTMTYHRLLTHGGFKTYRPVQYVLSVIGCLPLQGDPINWVSNHWKHHRYAEKKGLDPHTPRDGAWWSHMDWILHPDPLIKQEVELRKYASYLYEIPFYKRLRKVFWVPTTVWGLACVSFGGIHALGWGLAIPVVFGWHFTWLINSGTHMWGKRRFDTNDDSRNTWWIALLTFGEGWHNNHHAQPVKARHGIVWWEFDPTWYTIKTLQAVGLVWDVKD